MKASLSKLLLSKKDHVKVLKGAGLAGGAASLVYLIEAIPSLDLGLFAPVLVAFLSVKLNYLRKLLAQHKPKKKK